VQAEWERLWSHAERRAAHGGADLPTQPRQLRAGGDVAVERKSRSGGGVPPVPQAVSRWPPDHNPGHPRATLPLAVAIGVLGQYQGAKRAPVTARDGWWPLDDEDEYDEMCRWPVILDDAVRAPPSLTERQARQSA
jgi:hypothetical protein